MSGNPDNDEAVLSDDAIGDRVSRSESNLPKGSLYHYSNPTTHLCCFSRSPPLLVAYGITVV